MSKKNSSLLNVTAIVWLVISILSIVVHTPPDSFTGGSGYYFWTIVVVSLINATMAIGIIKAGKKYVNASYIVIVFTYLAIFYAMKVANGKFDSIAGNILSAIIPLILIMFLAFGKKGSK